MKPNIVILTIGCSGSTILCRMLEQLGWNLPDADQYAEHREFRKMNDDILLRRNIPAIHRQNAMIRRLTQPWILKDPRFVWTQQWWPQLNGSFLIWIEREVDAVEKSLRRKGWMQESPDGPRLRGRTLAEHKRQCEKIFEKCWRGPRLHITYEQLQSAVGLFTGPTDAGE